MGLFLDLIHIETLFYIGVIVLLIYFIWCKPKGIKIPFITNNKIDKKLIAKKPKRVNHNEERCRVIFEEIFKAKFKTIRPQWLKNPVTKHNLELDGYNPDIITPLGKGLAFEYDGVQHSKYTKYFHNSGENEFLYQRKKDRWKEIMCEKNGVMLIRIPHFVPYHDFKRYISNKLDRAGISTGVIDIENIYS